MRFLPLIPQTIIKNSRKSTRNHPSNAYNQHYKNTWCVLYIPFYQKNISLHTCQTNCGAFNHLILEKYDKICDELNKLNISVEIIATDGHKAFDFLHLYWFIKMIFLLKKEELLKTQKNALLQSFL